MDLYFVLFDLLNMNNEVDGEGFDFIVGFNFGDFIYFYIFI